MYFSQIQKQESEMPHTIHGILSDSENSKVARFAHDFNKLKDCTLGSWLDDWVASLIRADNRSSDYHVVLVGLGKTVRLLRMRNDFRAVDLDVKAAMVKAYRRAKNRVIVLDNKVCRRKA